MVLDRTSRVRHGMRDTNSHRKVGEQPNGPKAGSRYGYKFGMGHQDVWSGRGRRVASDTKRRDLSSYESHRFVALRRLPSLYKASQNRKVLASQVKLSPTRCLTTWIALL